MSLSHVSTLSYKSQVVSGNISESIGERVRVRKFNTPAHGGTLHLDHDFDVIFRLII